MPKAKKTRTTKEKAEREELFKTVAIAVLTSHPASALRGSADGTKVSEQFVDTVSLLTESVLEQAKTFGEK